MLFPKSTAGRRIRMLERLKLIGVYILGALAVILLIWALLAFIGALPFLLSPGPAYHK